jgi:hypothetical protein
MSLRPVVLLVLAGFVGSAWAGEGEPILRREAEVKVRGEVRTGDHWATDLHDETCVVRIRIDERGIPYDAMVETCAPLYAPYARDLALGYRFHPVRDAGMAVKAQFFFRINIRRAAAPPPIVPLVDPHPEIPLLPRGDFATRKPIQVRLNDMPPGLPEEGPLPPLQCVARVYVDERGLPFEVVPERCPELLVASATKTLLRARVKPIELEGVRSRASFRAQIDFATGWEVPEVDVIHPPPHAGDVESDERCVVSISIDKKGVPVDVTPKQCRALFVTAAREVAMRYRFHPVMDDGEAVAARFDLAINFKDPIGESLPAVAPPPVVPILDPYPIVPIGR